MSVPCCVFAAGFWGCFGKASAVLHEWQAMWTLASKPRSRESLRVCVP